MTNEDKKKITTAELLKYCNELDDHYNNLVHRIIADETAIKNLTNDIREIRDTLFDIELYLKQTAIRRMKPFRKE